MKARRAGPLAFAGAVAILIGALPAAAAPAQVVINYIEPKRFTDAGLNGNDRAGENEPALRLLARFLEEFGARHLAADLKLELDITDIDLAGQFEPQRGIGYTDVRIHRDTTPARIRLRYRLQRGDEVEAEGDETISDINYLQGPTAPYYAGDPLRYEKAMLDQWMRRRFAAFLVRT